MSLIIYAAMIFCTAILVFLAIQILGLQPALSSFINQYRGKEKEIKNQDSQSSKPATGVKARFNHKIKGRFSYNGDNRISDTKLAFLNKNGVPFLNADVTQFRLTPGTWKRILDDGDISIIDVDIFDEDYVDRLINENLGLKRDNDKIFNELMNYRKMSVAEANLQDGKNRYAAKKAEYPMGQRFRGQTRDKKKSSGSDDYDYPGDTGDVE